MAIIIETVNAPFAWAGEKLSIVDAAPQRPRFVAFFAIYRVKIVCGEGLTS